MTQLAASVAVDGDLRSDDPGFAFKLLSRLCEMTPETRARFAADLDAHGDEGMKRLAQAVRKIGRWETRG